MLDNSFAALVGKLNEIDNGRPIQDRQFKPTKPVTEGLAQNDMTSILENMYRDQPFESAKSLDSGTTKQFDKDYKPKQLPADYKMPSVGPVLGGDEEKIPTKGYMVGDSIDPDMLAKLAGDAEEIDITDKGEYDEEEQQKKSWFQQQAQ